MRTPTRSSSRPSSSTPKKQRMSEVSRPQEVEKIPIDPALLGENCELDDDLEDAEGEIVDEDIDLVTVQRPSNTSQPSRSASNHSSSRSNTRKGSFSHLGRQPRASSSRPSAARDLDDGSIASSLTPAPPRRIGRPPKPRTPFEATSVPNGHPRTIGKGKGKPNPAFPRPHPSSAPMKATASADSTVHVQVINDVLCSFCDGTDYRNKFGGHEKMVHCLSCGRCGHPSCLNMKSAKLCYTVMTYDWQCIECKTCEACLVKGDDKRLMFCDGCDRGYHSYCLDPPLADPPKGIWFCPKCQSFSRKQLQLPPSKSQLNPLIPIPSSRKSKGRASDASHITTVSTPAGRPRKSKNRDDIFGDQLPKIKIKPRGKGKERARTGSSSPAIMVRLRAPSGGRRQTVEVESEEDKVPFGGVITGAEADTTKTVINETDKEAFARSRKAAEAKLGGPPPPAWDPHSSIPTSPAPSSHENANYTSAPGKATPQTGSRSLRDRLLQQSVSHETPSFPFPSTGSSAGIPPTSTSQKIKTIRFGLYDIDTWYSAPYPEEYQHVPDGKLWLCEFCLKYMKSGFVAGRHRMKCKSRHPPGDEIYRDGSVSVFEVDGRKNKIYCQNLCLLAKMFLDHKTLYYDVEPFLFYVMTEVDKLGARFVGYFSKEKRSPDNNVSCIMTLPVRQRKGWGQLLIDFSYLLSKKEGRVGSPEKPLSGLGEVTYRKYWTLSVFDDLRNAPDNVTMDDISGSTSMTLDDIYTVLKHESMINVHDSPPPSYSTPFSRGRGRGRGRGRPSVNRRKTDSAPFGSEEKSELPTRYDIVFDRDYIAAVLRQHESRGHLILRPERLKYHPFLVTRNPVKPPGALAKATLMSANRVADSTPSEVVETPNGEIRNEVEKVVAGEDPATLALVAALSSESPERRLRKRESEEVNLEPVKRLRSGGSNTPNGMKRRSLRNVVDEHTPMRETRGRVNEIRAEVRNAMMDDPSETEEEEEERIEIRPGEGDDGGNDIAEEYGEEDAEGEVDEDAEREDDEEYTG